MIRRWAWLAAALAEKGCSTTRAEEAANPPSKARREMGCSAIVDAMAVSVFKPRSDTSKHASRR